MWDWWTAHSASRKLVRMRWLVLVPIALAATVGAAEERLPVGSASGALFYWHGHRIAPPYNVEIAFEPTPETTWTATYVNNLPVDGHSPPEPPAVDFGDPSLTPDQQALDRIAYREMRFDGERGFDLGEKLERRAEILRSEPSLVDSVRARSGSSMTVYWRGSRAGGSRTDWFLYPPPSTADWWRSGQESARALLKHLTGGVILWRSGPRSYLGGRRGIESEIDRFAAGQGPAPPEIRDTRTLAELRSPEPISELAQRLRPRKWSPPPCGMPRAPGSSALRQLTLELISSDALVFARARPIDPPFEVAAEYIVDPDTVWLTLLLNQQPVWRRPSTPVNWIVQQGAPCGRPPEFGMLSFALRSGGMVIAGADSAVYVPRYRREAYRAEIDSLRAGRQTTRRMIQPADLRDSFMASRN